jgi:hypothetical protein
MENGVGTLPDCGFVAAWLSLGADGTGRLPRMCGRVGERAVFPHPDRRVAAPRYLQLAEQIVDM